MNDLVKTALVPLLYLVSSVLFIYGLKLLGRVRTARTGNNVAAIGMFLAVLAMLLEIGSIDYRWIIGGVALGSAIGVVAAIRVPMTAMPEMVALFNGFGGLASTLVALAYVWLELVEKGRLGTTAQVFGTSNAATVGISLLIGGVTFSGSMIAYMKLNGSLKNGQAILLPARHLINFVLGLAALAMVVHFVFAEGSIAVNETFVLTAVALVLGVLLTIPIGGADMPVVVCLLNSYSGMAASATGFVLNNNLLIIAGALVGSSGIVLCQIMCVAMNRSLLNVLIGGFGGDAAAGAGNVEYQGVKSCGAEETAMLLESAQSVVFVPGYGLAVSQAQHAVRELANVLEKRGVKVSYAIHPVAGRMPGHMNVLLAEADVPYEQMREMDDINPDFKTTDVVLVLGANDVVNPAALTDKTSPIFGMPILTCYDARTVVVVKRSLGAGYAGIKNALFERENTTMIFADARKALQDITTELKSLG
jgi:NAD(P) transhydrogenase subunit beta